MKALLIDMAYGLVGASVLLAVCILWPTLGFRLMLALAALGYLGLGFRVLESSS